MLEEEHLNNVCKLGQGESTCSFLVFSSGGGFECAKGKPTEFIILQRRIAGEMRAKGNNCSGPPNFKPC